MVSLATASAHWLQGLHRLTPLVFADVGWDLEQLGSSQLAGKLASVDVFMPNASEARACTGAEDAERAAAALAADGPARRRKGRQFRCLHHRPHDPHRPTGACRFRWKPATRPGPATCSTPASSTLRLAGWPLEQSMRFANLCAAESVKHEGGSLAAPCWRDLAAFWERLEDAGRA